MPTQNQITGEDLARALAEIERQNKAAGFDYTGGFSFSEFRKALGASEGAARKRLREMVARGELECTGRHPRKNMVGERSMVPCYRIV